MKRALFLTAMFVQACTAETASSGNPTNADAIATVAPSECQRISECFPDQFIVVYGDVPSCVKHTEDGVPADQKNASGTCTSAQLDQCTKDMKTMSCPATPDAFVVPTSCTCG